MDKPLCRYPDPPQYFSGFKIMTVELTPIPVAHNFSHWTDVDAMVQVSDATTTMRVQQPQTYILYIISTCIVGT